MQNALHNSLYVVKIRSSRKCSERGTRCSLYLHNEWFIYKITQQRHLGERLISVAQGNVSRKIILLAVNASVFIISPALESCDLRFFKRYIGLKYYQTIKNRLRL